MAVMCAASYPGSGVATSLATRSASAGNLNGAVVQNMAWLAIADAVVCGSHSKMLCKALLAVLHLAVEVATDVISWRLVS
jgi:hypothetical protein